MRKRSRTLLNPDRDYQLFKFIWRWKVVPTDILHKRFFPNALIRTCYNRLANLRDSGYIDTIPIKDLACLAWVLCPKAFNTIKEYLPEDSDNGFRSESPNHDVLALRLQLGDWVSQPETDDLLFTEQELRRLSSVHYPDWVPFDFSRRPDGYIRSGSGASVKAIAIEIELSPKAPSEYETLAIDYAHCSKIDRAIWAVPSNYVARKLISIFSNYDSAHSPLHSFILLDDLAKGGWSSRIINGANRGEAIREVITRGSKRSKPLRSPNLPTDGHVMYCPCTGFEGK